MYKGIRDPMIPIVVPQAWCDQFKSRNDGKTWIEIHVPPCTALPGGDVSKWPSLAMPPDKVFFLDDTYNEFHVNAGADVRLAFKSKDRFGNVTILDEEFESTEFVRARILNYFLKLAPGWDERRRAPGYKPLTLSQIDASYRKSGRTMLSCLLQYLPPDARF